MQICGPIPGDTHCEDSAIGINAETWFSSGKVGITFPSTSSVHNPEELKAVQAVNPAMALAGPSGDGNIGEDSVGWGDSAV